MSRFTTTMKVGALSLVTVLAGVLILRFIDKGASDTGGYLVYVLMDDVSGIVKRSQVRIAGIPVGTVEDIRLEQDQGASTFACSPKSRCTRTPERARPPATCSASPSSSSRPERAASGS